MDTFRIDPNLRRLAIISFSNHVWNLPKMKKHLARNIKAPIEYHMTMPQELRAKLDKLKLPLAEKKELKLAVGTMGTRIRKFLSTTPRKPKGDSTNSIDFIEHIRWTHLGTIDTSETIKTLYNLDLLPMIISTFIRLCDECLLDCVDNFWGKLMTKIGIGRVWLGEPKGSFTREGHEIMSVLDEILRRRQFNNHSPFMYFFLYVSNRMSEFMEDEECRKFRDPNEVMFCYCLQSNMYQGAKYAWSCIMGSDRKKFVLEQNKYWLEELAHHNFYTEDNLIRDAADIDFIIFLLEILSETGYNDNRWDLSRTGLVLSKFLGWPCQDLFTPAIEDAWKRGGTYNEETIMVRLLDFKRQLRAYVGDESQARDMFRNFWDNSDRHFYAGLHLKDIARKLFEDRDIDLLKYMIVNLDSTEKIEKLLDEMSSFSMKSNIDKKFFSALMGEMFECEGAREWYHQNVK